LAWRDAYAELGVTQANDFSGDDPVIIGLYGGYAYLNLSYLRILGVRAPGSSAEAIDIAFFGEGDPPPYEPRKGDRSLLSSLRILRSVLGALGTRSMPPMVSDSFAKAEAHRACCPSLDAPDAELMAHLHAFPKAFGPAFHNHMLSSGLASIVTGMLADACVAAGEPGLVTHLVGSAGDVKSAEYSRDLYAIARTVRSQPALGAAFDIGVDGLLDRITGDQAAADFREQFAAFTAAHGHRGPNDWELSSRNWENTPELALVAIDRMRLADHDLDPATRLAGDDARRAAAVDVVRPHVKGLDRRNFDKALLAAPWWPRPAKPHATGPSTSGHPPSACTGSWCGGPPSGVEILTPPGSPYWIRSMSCPPTLSIQPPLPGHSLNAGLCMTATRQWNPVSSSPGNTRSRPSRSWSQTMHRGPGASRHGQEMY